jgi:hypothetical protein
MMIHAIFESLPRRTVLSSSISSLIFIAGTAAELALADADADPDAAELEDEPPQPASMAPAPAAATTAAEPATNERRETLES